MSRILLIHWNAAEAAVRAARLERAGHRVAIFSEPRQGDALKAFRSPPPDAILVDLGRLPSHGLAVAQWFRQNKSTRHAALVFVEGTADRVAKARALLPDATFTRWTRLATVLTHALHQPVAKPAVPGTMAGYSGTPLPKKLGIGVGASVALLDAPLDFAATLGSLPQDVTVSRQARGTADVVLLFTKSRADLDRRFAAATRGLAPRGKLWIAWPKKASGLQTDLGEATVRTYGLERDFVDYKICAIDTTWSGLCFARRRKA